MMPKSRPKAHRWIGADAHLHHMPVKVNNMDSGMMSAVIQRCPQIAQKQEQNRHDQRRTFDQVLLDRWQWLWSTRLVRSYTVTAFTPRRQALLITCMRSCTACATARLFSPISAKHP